MATENSAHKLNRLFVREKVFMAAKDQTPAALSLEKTRQNLFVIVKEAGRAGNLSMIVMLERRFLENDLVEHANSPAMAASLKIAMTELQGTEKTIPLTGDARLYKAVDESHGHPKTRSGNLPLDAARKFFSSHSARLLNMDKARLTAVEKQVIEARRANLRIAEKAYTSMQRQALGLPSPTPKKSQGRSL